MERPVRVRFAPSPTGPLHIGGVRTALYNYLFARRHGGTMILRIEDTDSQRFVPGAEEYILESLRWCGIGIDEGVGVGGPHAPYRQSERREIYLRYALQLVEAGWAYYAFDTAEELDALRREAEERGEAFAYNYAVREKLATSLALPADEVKARIERGDQWVIRFRMPENQTVEMDDLIRGHVEVNTSTLDDKVLYKSADALPTYHLANIVDDYLMEVSHVIRGEEWLPSLPLHYLLYRAFGWQERQPRFAHLPLLLKPTGGGKLSKRDGDKMGFPVFPLFWTSPTGETARGYREIGRTLPARQSQMVQRPVHAPQERRRAGCAVPAHPARPRHRSRGRGRRPGRRHHEGARHVHHRPLGPHVVLLHGAGRIRGETDPEVLEGPKPRNPARAARRTGLDRRLLEREHRTNRPRLDRREGIRHGAGDEYAAAGARRCGQRSRHVRRHGVHRPRGDPAPHRPYPRNLKTRRIMVQIEQHVWGMTPEGEAIILYTMRNDKDSEVKITNFGAAIVSVTMPNREGRMADVVLGYKHPEGYFFDGAASGKSVGRCANRIAFGRMTVEGKEYALEVNNGPNHLHGGTKNFANRIWESRVETNRVVMSLLSEDGDQNYPGELNVEAVFDFDDENALEITYLARTDKTTVVNLTNHVYFNLAGEGSGSVLDHQLRLNSSQVLEMNDKQIPTGRLLDAAGTPQDFREFRPFRPGIDSEFNHIRDFKGYDHPFVIDGWKPNILGEVGCLREQTSGRCVTVLSSQPSVMIYTGNWLAGGCPETKSGGRYNNYDGVAIECQNYPDAVNHPEFPSPLLRPGETYCQKIVFRFGTFA